MSSNGNWKTILRDQIEPQLGEEIDAFEAQIALKKQGKVDEKVFGETRLRRGAYGQRYDNGQRHDGTATQQLAFPSGDLTKGSETIWDAPGMQRIKIPFGGLSADQLDLLAAVAEEYSDGILHVTTRQDFQLHYVHIEDTPDMMRRLAAVGITTQEACGNGIRNVTACIVAGVCHEEAFDVTPYSDALAQFLLGHPDCQDFGRKFKVTFSGCAENACGLVSMHDMGYIARTRTVDGVEERGFDVYVGGGLGAVPRKARLIEEFVSEEEVLPVAQAVCRVFARHGEKAKRSRARIKFLIDKMGVEEFQRLVREERPVMPHDDRWTAYLKDIPGYKETPARQPAALNGEERPEGFEAWQQTNIYQQRQEGYCVVTVNLPLGDLTSSQTRRLADIAREYTGDNIRITVEQNVVLRWIAEADLPAIFTELKTIGLGDPGAGTIVDITACPGTDTCKLGISSSRGLAGELRTRLITKSASLDAAVKDLKIKISGCFNSCAQHHVADLGFYGASRRVGAHMVPHFQVVVGGKWGENAGSYGLAVGSVPSKSVPDVVDAVTDRYVAERTSNEGFQDWVGRVGKKEFRAMLQPFMTFPTYEEDASYYSDWNDPREYSTQDMGTGECAGEMVSLFSLEIIKAESEVFEAQLALDEADYRQADDRAYKAMLLGALALVRTQFLDVGDQPGRIVDEFRTRFYDTKLFFDKYAGAKFADYFIDRHENPRETPDRDTAHPLVEEAQLFIEAAHACDQRVSSGAAGSV